MDESGGYYFAAENPGRHLKHADLTDREIEMLRLIAKGATNREIAGQLVISEGTVKNHIMKIVASIRERAVANVSVLAVTMRRISQQEC